MKGRNWYTDDNYGGGWAVLVLFFIILISFHSKVEASTTQTEYNFGPEIVELHIIKNDGMNSHEVYTCRNVRTCYNLYLEKRMKDMSINCATKMYIERSNGNIMRLKV